MYTQKLLKNFQFIITWLKTCAIPEDHVVLKVDIAAIRKSDNEL